MTPARKLILLALGFLAAFLIVSQLVLGQLLHNGQASLRTAHRHSGYTTVGVTVAYIFVSLWFTLTSPTQPRPRS